MPHIKVKNTYWKKFLQTLWFSAKVCLGVLLISLTIAYGPAAVRIYHGFPTGQNQSKINHYEWEYKGKKSIDLTLNKEVDDYYLQSGVKNSYFSKPGKEYWQKIFTDGVDRKDHAIQQTVSLLQQIAADEKYSDDQTVDMVVKFVQTIPYDQEKSDMMDRSEAGETLDDTASDFIKARLPYETLYDDKGICTDKTYLTVKLLSLLGYGTAVVNTPKHLAAAVQCPIEASTGGSGYCYIETTNEEFVIGDIPRTQGDKAVSVSRQESGARSSKPSISKDDVVPLSRGKSYNKALQTKPILDELVTLEIKLENADIATDKESARLDAIVANTIEPFKQQADAAYAVYKRHKTKANYAAYENKFLQYRKALDEYRPQVEAYNSSIDDFDAIVNHIMELRNSII